MATWTRQSQETGGKYQFSGQFVVTQTVKQELTKVEIIGIYYDILKFVEEQGGIDYLQVYIDEQGRKLFFIDQLSTDMIQSGEYREEDNCCTLLFAHEY
ncbi:hypothetical protein QM480_24640 [Flectobacillus sp. DC10W]|uniref:Uncharacterized protein n=1 Tax=Flectobacillus longus TaxID=2984207 RepID=A0ABT6YVK9_9BACT|nr:hypothetical protein [Flectobacillus longus]MDI9867556.1 hypothetical protein [Flectobacillus longus]